MTKLTPAVARPVVQTVSSSTAMTADDAFDFRHVVLQPTTACNLNCSYCYLPGRSRSFRMSCDVARAVAVSLDPVPHKVGVLWHGGEPLAAGLPAFKALTRTFSHLRRRDRIEHSLQTNAGLINDDWCSFFTDEDFKIGVSLDGPREQNSGRLNWNNKPAYDSAIRGIRRLKRHRIPFGVIAVVNPENVADPGLLYDFFLELGCTSLNINVEEREGLNRQSTTVSDGQVRDFWIGLFTAWRANPVLRVREFDEALGWMEAVCGDTSRVARPLRDMWPTVAWDGQVVVLSPELMAVTEAERPRFVVGNVLETPLPDIVRRSKRAPYVADFWDGNAECRARCSYFSYCGGGQASNKYFELGTTKGTETAHCRHSRQAVVDAVVTGLSSIARIPLEQGGRYAK